MSDHFQGQLLHKGKGTIYHSPPQKEAREIKIYHFEIVPPSPTSCADISEHYCINKNVIKYPSAFLFYEITS